MRTAGRRTSISDGCRKTTRLDAVLSRFSCAIRSRVGDGVPPAWRHVVLVVCVCLGVSVCVCVDLSSAASGSLDGGQVKGDSDPLATFNHAVALQQKGQLEA